MDYGPMKQYALSLKQPWAALLAHGLKTIEMRRWPTARRGRILIHAARVPDQRPQAWDHVPAHCLQTAQLLGGILGAGELIDCRTYRTLQAFQADQQQHLNDPSWFQAPLYGFVFADLTVLPFRRYPGWMRFFAVEPANRQSAIGTPADEEGGPKRAADSGGRT